MPSCMEQLTQLGFSKWSQVDAIFVPDDRHRFNECEFYIGLADVDVMGEALKTVDSAATAAPDVNLSFALFDNSFCSRNNFYVVFLKADWFASYVNLVESAIKLCNNALISLTGQKSFGASIVLFTLLVKGLTYPLTYAQLRSTTKMQALQPKVPPFVWFR